MNPAIPSVAEHAAAPDVAEALEGLIHVMKRVYRRGLAAQGVDLSPYEIHALLFAGRESGAGLHQLAQDSGRDKAQVTRTTKALEHKGLLSRERDPADLRCCRLVLTRRGRELYDIIREVRAGIDVRLFADLDAAEQKKLSELLERCRLGLEHARGGNVPA